MRTLAPRVVDVIWSAVESLLPPKPPDRHRLGCHRRRIADRVCCNWILYRLVTGCSWDGAGRLAGLAETTLRRRDEWLTLGVFDRLRSCRHMSMVRLLACSGATPRTCRSAAG